MPAEIIETNPKAFETVAIDPVTLDISENALRNARIEMDATLVRTAMSPGIREQGDAFPLIADPSGKMIVGQFGSFIDGFLKGYDDTLEDGDMIFLSDPYSCEGAISHSNDWLVLLPVFKDGRLIAYTAMFGHQSDIGGMVPGSMPIGASSIFEEGVRIPPVKIWKKGARMTDDGLLVQGATSTVTHGSARVHVEFRLPYKPLARGQGRGNSGLYVQGRYETQMLDSFGLDGNHNECGGIYSVRAPDLNVCLPPLAWQTYDVEFTAAEFGADGKKTKNARMTVWLNGRKVQDDVALETGVAVGEAAGPLVLRDDGDRLRYRNVWVLARSR